MVAIKAVSTEGKELEIVRKLFADYQKELGEDLCFQSFEAELKEPLKKYGAGVIYLALYNGEPAGCIALAPLADENGRKACEMKRLYVVPGLRQFGIGRQLVDALLDKARELGYGVMKLDTLGKLGPAIELYKNHGFRETTSYYDNPLPGVVYMEKEL
jgi:putative acetyltransferase